MKSLRYLFLSLGILVVISISLLWKYDFKGFAQSFMHTKAGRCMDIITDRDTNKHYGKYNPKEYFARAKEFEKNESYLKAYLYYERVTEIEPDGDMAQKAKQKMKSLYNKIDKSHLLKKPDF